MKNNDTIRIVFTGDAAFSGPFEKGYENGCLSEEVCAFLNDADFAAVNLESPVTKKDITSSRALNHRSDPDCAAFLAGHNMKLWLLANNHIMDCGPEGLKDTKETALEYGCRILGAGDDLRSAAAPVILGEQVKVGLINVSRPWKHIRADENRPGAFTWDHEDVLKETIQDLKKQADKVVVIVHGEDEFCDLPMPYTRNRYLNWLEHGADLVIGHHPHVVQNYETAGEKRLYYSLGNFIFDTKNQREHPNTEKGILLAAEFSKQTISFEPFAIAVNKDKNIVEKAQIPPIFCDIGENEYEKLWPLEAKYFYREDVQRRLATRPGLSQMSSFKFRLHELKSFKNEKEGIVQKGRREEKKGKWKKSALQDVVSYIRGE